MKDNKEWFDLWFNSPYYHLLYRHRNEKEAHDFIDHLIRILNLHPGMHILDLACGKGRHAIYLNELGFRVTGLDLSEQNIHEASRHSNPRLDFHVHDMCLPLPGEYDLILNLFTSFGYFSSQEEHQRVINQIRDALPEGGLLVLDYLNTHRTIDLLTPREYRLIENVEFGILRFVDEEVLVKDIVVDDSGEMHHFQERVRGFEKADFLQFFKAAGLKPEHIFGTYDLERYDPDESPRMIFICRKTHV